MDVWCRDHCATALHEIECGAFYEWAATRLLAVYPFRYSVSYSGGSYSNEYLSLQYFYCSTGLFVTLLICIFSDVLISLVILLRLCSKTYCINSLSVWSFQGTFYTVSCVWLHQPSESPAYRTLGSLVKPLASTPGSFAAFVWSMLFSQILNH